MMDKMQNAKTMEKKNVGNDKLRLLAVLKIMQRTDEDHPLTKNQIMNKVVEQGIEVSNIKTIAADLATLKDAGYDIVTNYSGSFMTDGQIFQKFWQTTLPTHVICLWKKVNLSLNACGRWQRNPAMR